MNSGNNLVTARIAEYIPIIKQFQEGVSLVYEGILPGSPTPKFTNLVTMVHPNDNMVWQKFNLQK